MLLFIQIVKNYLADLTSDTKVIKPLKKIWQYAEQNKTGGVNIVHYWKTRLEDDDTPVAQSV